jgi:hypothetical protein
MMWNESTRPRGAQIIFVSPVGSSLEIDGTLQVGYGLHVTRPHACRKDPAQANLVSLHGNRLQEKRASSRTERPCSRRIQQSLVIEIVSEIQRNTKKSGGLQYIYITD